MSLHFEQFVKEKEKKKKKKKKRREKEREREIKTEKRLLDPLLAIK